MFMDLAILIVRLLFGTAIAAHGAQKLFGSFGGYGLKGTAGFFETIGFRPGMPFVVAAGLGEFGGGILLALGLLTPVGAAAVISAMLVAMISVHLKNGFFAMNNGIEMPFLYASAAVGLALTGGGAFSMDAWLGLASLFSPIVILGFLLLSIVGATLTLVLRHQPQKEKTMVS